MNIRNVVFLLSFAACVSFLPEHSSAQEALTSQGVAGDIDKGNRGPELSVRTENRSGTIAILADAHVPDTSFEKYPIQFDFFINRKLFSSQYRSPTLPGAVGVDIGPDVATTPFNYTVVATVLHPNRGYTTVIEGAVFDSALATELNCTLTVETETSEEETDELTGSIYTAENVPTNQVGNNVFEIEFTAADESGENEISIDASVTINSGEESTGSITTTDAEENTTTSTGTATVDTTDGALNSLTILSDDGLQTLTCSN